MLELSSDQKYCFNIMMEWVLRPSKKLLTFGGYAGCGKTTLVTLIRKTLPQTTRIAFCSYTGKASSVLRSKISQHGIILQIDDFCGTIHSLIYEPIKDDETDEIMGWKLRENLNYDLIIIDEASMIGEDLFDDLSSYGIPLLAVGDHGQLPPIDGAMNLMANPEIKLEKIHRFAEQDALIKVSIMARENGQIPYGTFGDCVHKVHFKDKRITSFINDADNFSDSAILCGFNRTRIENNKKIRKWIKKDGLLPLYGERIICLKNNRYAKNCPIYNGVIGTVKSCIDKGSHLKLRVSIDGEMGMYEGCVSRDVFNNEKPEMDEYIIVDRVDEKRKNQRFHNLDNKCVAGKHKLYLDCFDFGYCLTVHKSQGSEWSSVLVIEQICSFWSGDNWNKWLYTAVTRSKNRLLIVA